MRFDQIAAMADQKNMETLLDFKKFSKTLEFGRKVDEAMRALDVFFETCENPAVSCGGGKDGTAVALLARQNCVCKRRKSPSGPDGTPEKFESVPCRPVG